MGFIDFVCDVSRRVADAAEAALEAARRLAEEAERRIREAAEAAANVAREVERKVEGLADSMRHDVEKLMPSFDDKMAQIIDEVTKVATEAAAEGVDVTDAINGAIELALAKVKEALDAAIDAINRFLHAAENTLFGFLESVLPESFRFILEPARSAVRFVLSKLDQFGDFLKRKIAEMLAAVKEAAQSFVRKVGEVLGPIWDFLKQLWRMIFGEEPEHCAMAAQWFQDRLRRTQRTLLHKRAAEPVGALLYETIYFEALPPDLKAWSNTTLAWLDQHQNNHLRCAPRDKMTAMMSSTKLRPGDVIQLTFEEPFVDSFGGRGQAHVSVLYYRWRTDDFRKVSAGFLGIVGMVTSIGEVEDSLDGPTSKPGLSLHPSLAPLQMSARDMKTIYDAASPSLRLGIPAKREQTTEPLDCRKGISKQLRYRDDDGVWRVVNQGGT